MNSPVSTSQLPTGVAQAEVLVLVLTMDLPPFDYVYAQGANATWLQQRVPGVEVVEYRGRPIPHWRLPFAGIRERLRLRSSSPVDPVFGTEQHPAIRLMNSLSAYAFSQPERPRANVLRYLLRFVHALLRALEMMATALDGHRLARVRVMDGVVHVSRLQTIAKMIDVQLPVFDLLLRESSAQGFLVATMSTYVEFERTLQWHREAVKSRVDFASLECVNHRGRQFQGGCMYFSRQGLEALVRERRQLRGGVINDIAITDWLVRTGRSWVDLPALSLTGVNGVPATCPLCQDPQLMAVRCTQHADRGIEVARLRALHHTHS